MNNNFSKNINIDLIVEYKLSFDSGLAQAMTWDSYNRGDFYDRVYGTLESMPLIDASSFTHDIVTLENKETVLNDLIETFEGEYSGTEFLTLASTNIYKYLKYRYDEANETYYIEGFNKNIHSVGYFAVGFGKEKVVICSNAFSKRNIRHLMIGPNVIEIEENAFPALTTSLISICEGVEHISGHAFNISGYASIEYGGNTIPESWSSEWNKKTRTFYKTRLGVEELKLSDVDLGEKIDNYNKYKDVTWLSSGQSSKEDVFEANKNNKEKLIVMLKNGTANASQIPEQFKDDEEVMLTAIARDRDSLQYAGAQIKNNKAFLLRFIESFRDGRILKYASSDLKNDSSFITKAISSNADNIKWIGEQLNKDKDFWTEVVKVEPRTIEYAPEEMLDDKDVALATVNKNGAFIREFSERIRKDREIAIAAIKSNGSALGYIDESLGFDNDIEIVKTAISTNCYALRYASERLQKNEEVALFAIKSNASCIDVLHKDLLKNRQFILKAMSVVDKPSLEFAYEMFMSCADDSLLDDKSFMDKLKRESLS